MSFLEICGGEYATYLVVYGGLYQEDFFNIALKFIEYYPNYEKMQRLTRLLFSRESKYIYLSVAHAEISIFELLEILGDCNDRERDEILIKYYRTEEDSREYECIEFKKVVISLNLRSIEFQTAKRINGIWNKQSQCQSY